jgi:hypothetical protein
MMDPGLEDEDIAEIFSRSIRWAAVVRSRSAELREAEYIASHLEYLDEGLQPGDPVPWDILTMAEEIRLSRRTPSACV